MKNTNKNTPATIEKEYHASFTTDITDATIRPADNEPDVLELIKEGCGQYNSVHEIAGEPTDNSFSAIISSGVGSAITITITQQLDGDIEMVVEDDGPGIANIDQALTYGSKAGAQTNLNAHGFGPKQVPAKSITVESTYNGVSVVSSGPFVPGVLIATKTAPIANLPHGVRWTFVLDSEYLHNEVNRYAESTGAAPTQDFMTLCEYCAETLGFMYAGLMLRNPHIKFNVVAKTLSPKAIRNFPVTPLYLVFDKQTTIEGQSCSKQGRKSIPAFHNMPGQIDLVYSVGAATTNRPSLLGYGAKAQSSQCWYVSMGGRMLGRTSRLSGHNVVHPEFNGIMGVVDIDAPTAAHAPRTTVSKTAFDRHDGPVLEKEIFKLAPKLMQMIKSLTKTKSLHDVICDNIAEAASNESSADDIIREYVIEGGTEEKVDVVDYAREIGYEVKTKAASVADVNQAKGYIETMVATASMLQPCPIKVMYLCATSFPNTVLTKMNIANQFLEKCGIAVRLEAKCLHDMPEAKYRTTVAEFRKKNKKTADNE